MTIPGVKIIDDILKGLPENARLRSQLGELRTQVEGLQRELETARTEIQVSGSSMSRSSP